MEFVKGIKDEVFRFYEEMFKDPDSNRPTLDGIQFKALSQVQSQIIEEPFIEKEIKSTI